MKISIIANPVAGRGHAYKKIDRCVKHWRHADWEVKLLTTHYPGDAGALVHEQLQHPPDLLAICGGDGTLNEVVTRVPDPPFPIALLPAGTANVLAKELRLPLDPIMALNMALNRTVRRVDVGNLNGITSHRFLLMAGIGFDAYVVSKVRPGLKARFGMAAYGIAIVNCLLDYSFPEFQVTACGETFTATSCIVANAKSYGGGFVFTPEATMSDGLLDILVLQGRRRGDLARFLFQAWRGKPGRYSWARHLQACSLKIEGSSGLCVQADGELAGALPLEISISPASFPLVIPRKARAEKQRRGD